MTTHIELDRETTPVKEPAKAQAWKNRWLVAVPGIYICPGCNMKRLHSVGDDYIDCCEVYPNRSAAEFAGEQWSGHVRVANYQRYLGAVRVPT